MNSLAVVLCILTGFVTGAAVYASYVEYMTKKHDFILHWMKIQHASEEGRFIMHSVCRCHASSEQDDREAMIASHNFTSGHQIGFSDGYNVGKAERKSI